MTQIETHFQFNIYIVCSDRPCFMLCAWSLLRVSTKNIQITRKRFILKAWLLSKEWQTYSILTDRKAAKKERDREREGGERGGGRERTKRKVKNSKLKTVLENHTHRLNLIAFWKINLFKHAVYIFTEWCESHRLIINRIVVEASWCWCLAFFL